MFSSIESLWDSTGVGGHYQSVSGLIATIQWFNIIALLTMLSKLLDFKIGIILLFTPYVILIVFNWIYFKEAKIKMVLIKYDKYSQAKKIFIGIATLIYIIISFVAMIISY